MCGTLRSISIQQRDYSKTKSSADDVDVTTRKSKEVVVISDEDESTSKKVVPKTEKKKRCYDLLSQDEVFVSNDSDKLLKGYELLKFSVSKNTLRTSGLRGPVRDPKQIIP